MRNDPLSLPHPIEQLEMYDLDPAKWDCLHPPDLFVVGDPALVPPRPYMPPLGPVEVQGKDSVEPLENGRCNHCFRLTCEVNEIWRSFFRKHPGNERVAFEGNRLTITCGPEELPQIFGDIARDMIPKATNDYRRERECLVWRVFYRMKEQERRDATEAEVLEELTRLRRRQQECANAAQVNGWSVPFVVQNHNDRYREILENKWVWWGEILNEATMRKYRALFEQELLVM